MPRLTLSGERSGPGTAGAISAAALRHVLAECGERGVLVGGDGVLELAGNPATITRHHRLCESGLLDPVDGRIVDMVEASRIAGVTLDRPALWYRRAGWVSPPALVRALAGDERARLGCPVDRLLRVGDAWRLVGTDGGVIDEAGVVVVACGPGTTALAGLADLPLTPVRGQLSELPETPASRRLRAVLTFGGYLTPAVGGRHVAGATYDREGFDPMAWPQPVTAESHARVRAALPGLLDGWFGGVAAVRGRAAVRATTPDRMPLAGAIAEGGAVRQPGLYVLAGLGSRGLVTAPLLAEMVVSAMLFEPLPLESDLAAALRPQRFRRRLRRS